MNGPQVMTSPLFLGIDTGGTYTDAVLYSESEGVLASAKSLTTRHDLAIGVSGAVETVLAEIGAAVGRIRLVSLSTTLATNALVEGQGRTRRACDDRLRPAGSCPGRTGRSSWQ
jgi:N-methylhydantoinase A/oxoprolinase/acetone carboxylase beta subunit